MSRKRKPTIDGNALIRTKAFAPRRFMTEVNRLREQGATDGEIVAAMAASKVAAGAARPSRQELTGHDDRAAMTIHSSRQSDCFGFEDPLIGLYVKLERAIDRRRPCHDNMCEIASGRGPHRYALLCATCGTFRGWLPKAAALFVAKTICVVGALDVPLIWRDETVLR
jgi:hypothetical protein